MPARRCKVSCHPPVAQYAIGGFQFGTHETLARTINDRSHGRDHRHRRYRPH
jgi:hypothetical protein